MRAPFFPRCWFVLLFLASAAATGPCAHAAGKPAPAAPPPDAVAQLQTLVFGLADRYVQGYAELLTELTAADSTPAPLRLTAQLEKVHTASAVYSLAAGPSPEAALLDLMALSTLRCLHLEKNLEARFGISPAQGERLIAFAREAEKEIWGASARYLTKEQAAELRQLAETWYAQNSDLEFSSLVHFHDFYAAHASGALGEVIRGGSRGMLGPLRDAVASIDEARLVSERAMFLSVRLPLLARWQVEALAYRALTMPESRELFATAGTLATAATDVARELNQLPAKLTEERRALLEGATALTGEFGRVVAEARTTVTEAAPVIDDARATGELVRTAAQDVRAALDAMAAIQRTHATSNLGAMTPEQILAALTETRRTAEISQQILHSLNQAIASSGGQPSALDHVIATTEASSRRTIDHAALRAVQVLAGGILLWGAVAWLVRRNQPPPIRG